MFLSSRDLQLGRGEPISDTARVLSRYVDGIMARTYAHSTVEDLGRFASVPVINGLSDLLHPCQALADFLTIRERFGDRPRVRRSATSGDGNNVAHRLLLTGRQARREGRGRHAPKGFGPEPRRRRLGGGGRAGNRGIVLVTTSLEEGVAGARAVYTDVWASMGQEAEAAERPKKFEPYQRYETRDADGRARRHLSPLPARPPRRGSRGRCDRRSEISAVFDQAENRLHAQKALLVTLLANGG